MKKDLLMTALSQPMSSSRTAPQPKLNASSGAASVERKINERKQQKKS